MDILLQHYQYFEQFIDIHWGMLFVSAPYARALLTYSVGFHVGCVTEIIIMLLNLSMSAACAPNVEGDIASSFVMVYLICRLPVAVGECSCTL